MRRLLLSAGMLLMCVLSTFVMGVCWLRHAPTFPDAMHTITPGMTIAAIEARLGQRLVGHRGCVAVDYFVQLPDHWWYGQVACLYLSASPRPYDTPDAPIIDGGDLVCRQVDHYRFPKLDQLSRLAWVGDLLSPQEP